MREGLSPTFQHGLHALQSARSAGWLTTYEFEEALLKLFEEALLEIEWQLLAETRANHMSYTWPVLRAAQGLFKATSFQGGSMVSSPPFFDSAGRGQLTFWGTQSGPMVVVGGRAREPGREASQLRGLGHPNTAAEKHLNPSHSAPRCWQTHPRH